MARVKPRIKIILLYILSFVCSVAPVTVYFCINHNKYIMTVPDKVKLSIGAVIVAIIVVLKLIGKLKVNSRIAVFATVFLLAYLLEAVLADLLVFSFLALCGEIADTIIMAIVKKMKRDLLVKESAEVNAQANAKEMEEAFKRLSGRV